MSKYYKFSFVFLLIINITACGIGSYLVEKGGNVVDAISPKGISLDWKNLTFIAVENANSNSPIRADVVLLNDEATLEIITSLTAAKWFASRSDFEKTIPYALSYKSIEIVPGQSLVLSADVFKPGRVAGVLLFADYLSTGEHRMRLDQFTGEISVQFGERSFSVFTHPNK